MKVKLNAWRGEDGPGDIIDLDDGDAAAMIHNGTAHPVDEDADKAEDAPAAPRVVKGSATVTATSGTAAP